MTTASDKPVLDEYSRLACSYDRRWSFYIHATIRETVRRMRPQPGDRVLDVGCGTGMLLDALREKNVKLAGLDPCPAMLAVARDRLTRSVDLREGVVEELPFEDNHFHWVVSTSAFHYFRRPLAALAEMRRVLRPGGRLLITDWCDDYLTCRVCDWFLRRFNAAHFQTYRMNECRTLLNEAGFADVEVARYKINWLWGMMTAQGVKPPAALDQTETHHESRNAAR